MNREEKNRLTRRRIMDSALAEFASQGYGASSVNTIAASEQLSKGIIYHYFENKDELYLACVEECFQSLTEYLRREMERTEGGIRQQLEAYFSYRVEFFRANPVYQPIFCEAVVSPPGHLEGRIRQKRRAFDAFTAETLEQLLQPLSLRDGLTVQQVVELFRQFQDFINAQDRETAGDPQQRYELRDEYCRRMLDVLLYGVLERGIEQNV